MYPSNSNGYYRDHSFLNHGQFATDEDQDPSLSFFNFPSPYYNQCKLDDVFLLHNQTLMPDSVSGTIINMPAGSIKNEDSKKATEVQQPPRKRLSSSKRDRHSKINTANGLRDRRMRLSLDVAREFFGLQDMLRFDKASRTVEWLLIQARHEIRKLRTRASNTNNSSVSVAAKSPSSTSEAEVVSSLEGIITTMGKPTMVEKKVRQKPLAKELREKARAREKARVRAKARTKSKKLSGETNNNDLNNEHNTSLLQATVAEAKEFDSRGIEHMIDEPMATINNWSSNPMFNCLQNSGINQEHQLTGFLSFGKPWETYN